jgi:hypothetical protein
VVLDEQRGGSCPDSKKHDAPLAESGCARLTVNETNNGQASNNHSLAQPSPLIGSL